VRDYYLSSFLNQTLPGGVAGDAVRAVRRRGPEAGGWKVPALAVAMERASGQGVFAGLAGAGLIIWPLYGFGELPSDVSRLLTGIAVVAGCLGASILLLLTFPPKALYRRISSLKRAIRTAFVDDGAWRVQSVLSLMVVGSYLGLYMLASAAVGAPLPYLAAITVIPLCLLMMLVPATVAGWGAREAAAALLWPLFGYSSSDGVAASIFYGALLLVGAVPGLAVAIHMLLSDRRAR
ncbi:MAG TPA: lysylphosphatidylglycerol synthase transmembrane domain-containing protein, partial [Pseudorhizobium sp.]|nr:lysylphosphatidylglycerol synthase transmembrane domain-containing protein [Pseudorhizobium sp.]